MTVRMKLVALGISASAAMWLPSPVFAQARYRATQTGDIVQLQDTQAQVIVNVLTTAANAYQMTVKGEDVIRRTWTSIDDIRARMGLNGIPLLWPYANRLDEQAFYANGQKYTFDSGLGNTGRGAIPIHGFLTGATAWKLVETKADARSAVGHDEARFLSRAQLHEAVPVRAHADLDLSRRRRRDGGPDPDRQLVQRADAGGDRVSSVLSVDRLGPRGVAPLGGGQDPLDPGQQHACRLARPSRSPRSCRTLRTWRSRT